MAGGERGGGALVGPLVASGTSWHAQHEWGASSPRSLGDFRIGAFTSIDHLRGEGDEFIDFKDINHAYSAQGGLSLNRTRTGASDVH